MKNILLFTNLRYLDRRVLQPCDYSKVWDDLIKQGGGNSGNKLFTYAIEKYLSRPGIHYQHYSEDMLPDYINDFFDLIIIPMANILNPRPAVKKEMEFYADYFDKIKIPVYIIGIGAQAASYDHIRQLYEEIKEPATKFIKTIYKTGGDFTVRGYFTKELFDRLGFKDVFVSGCPSIYQNGRNLNIQKKKIINKDFAFCINGDLLYLQEQKLLRVLENKNSVFMDQNEFAELLYSHHIKRTDLLDNKNMRAIIRKYTLTGIKALTEGRAKLFYDVPIWLEYLKNGNFYFSFGSRIHGNIAAILSGIPAVVYYRDSRTRELAEFFHIPCTNNLKLEPDNHDSLKNFYTQINYDKFNHTFSSKFDEFEKFLIERNILDSITEDITFNNQIKKSAFELPQIQNIEYIATLKQIIEENKQWILYDAFVEKGRSIKRKVKREQ